MNDSNIETSGRGNGVSKMTNMKSKKNVTLLSIIVTFIIAAIDHVTFFKLRHNVCMCVSVCRT